MKAFEYLSTAHRLNLRQTQLGLFFTRFNFTVAYHPRSENKKADVLSWIYPSNKESGNSSIHPLSILLNSIHVSVGADAYHSSH